MNVSGKSARWLSLLAAVFLVTPASGVFGAESPSTAVAQEAVKRKMVREKAFLLRAAEEQDRTLALVMETTALLERQVDAVESLTDKRGRDLKELLDWYVDYTGWVGGIVAESEADLAEYLSRPPAGGGWQTRYEGTAKGYRRLSTDLSGRLRALEEDQGKDQARIKKLRPAVVEGRILVDKEELELSRELKPSYRYHPYDQREAVYRDLSVEEVGLLRRELQALEEQQKHYEAVIELERYELSWLSLKAEESAALQGVAQALADDSPGALRNACREAIRIYEADVRKLARKTDELRGKVAGMARTGTLKTLDRLKDLTDYYETIKSRFERHREWLQGQIGGFHADLVELEKERER